MVKRGSRQSDERSAVQRGRAHVDSARGRAGSSAALQTTADTHAPTPVQASALLGNPRLGSRGNAGVRAAAMHSAQQTYGNRALQRMLGRATAPGAPQQATPSRGGLAPAFGPVAVQRSGPDEAGGEVESEGKEITGRKNGPHTLSEVVEFNWELRRERLWNVSLRFTISQRNNRLVENKPAEGETGPTFSLLENKAAATRQASGKMAYGLSSTLLKTDMGGTIWGIPVKGEIKFLEGKWDAITEESDLDLIKIAGSMDGLAPQLAQYFGPDVPQKVKEGISVRVSGKFEIPIPAAELVRLKQIWRAEKEIAEGMSHLAQQKREIERLRKQAKSLDKQG